MKVLSAYSASSHQGWKLFRRHMNNTSQREVLLLRPVHETARECLYPGFRPQANFVHCSFVWSCLGLHLTVERCCCVTYSLCIAYLLRLPLRARPVLCRPAGLKRWCSDPRPPKVIFAILSPPSYCLRIRHSPCGTRAKPFGRWPALPSASDLECILVCLVVGVTGLLPAIYNRAVSKRLMKGI